MAKRFLLVTRKFPPASGGGTPRMLNFAVGLSQFGWQATVVTPNVNDGWVDKERMAQLADVEVTRIGSMTRKKRSLRQKIAGRIMLLDPHFPWAFEALRATRVLQPGSFDLILTSGPPHSVHYVGWRLGKEHSLKWVADFRDHFTLAPEYRTFSPINTWLDRYFEKQIYQSADAVITNTRINRRDLLRNFGDLDPAKVVTIHNGFDALELKGCEIPVPWADSEKKPLNYVYLGGLRGQHVDRFFFDGVDLAIRRNPGLRNEFAIRIVGDARHLANSIQAQVERGVVTIHDPVPAKHVGSVLANADAGLFWQRADARYRGTIPQKFFEYLGTHTPVFFVGRTDGEVANLCRRYGIGMAADAISQEHVADAFVDFHEAMKLGKLDYSKCPSRVFKQFDRSNHSRMLAGLFDDLAN